MEDARRRIIRRLFAELDARDLDDFDRLTKKLLAALEGVADDSIKP